jgi:hypothetical protein
MGVLILTQAAMKEVVSEVVRKSPEGKCYRSGQQPVLAGLTAGPPLPSRWSNEQMTMRS